MTSSAESHHIQCKQLRLKNCQLIGYKDDENFMTIFEPCASKLDPSIVCLTDIMWPKTYTDLYRSSLYYVGWMMDDPGFDSQRGQEIFLFPNRPQRQSSYQPPPPHTHTHIHTHTHTQYTLNNITQQVTQIHITL